MTIWSETASFSLTEMKKLQSHLILLSLPGSNTPTVIVFVEEAYKLLNSLLNHYLKCMLNEQTEYFNTKLSKTKKNPSVFHILLKHQQVTPKLADITVKYRVFKNKTFISALSKLLNVLAVTVCT